MTYTIALPVWTSRTRPASRRCPVDCIYEGERMLDIHPDECVDCGARVSRSAGRGHLRRGRRPRRVNEYTKANADFFTDLGSPGGAAKLGLIAQPRRSRSRHSRRRSTTTEDPARLPWDSAAPYKARAAAHPGGIVDLSIGTPVDPTPPVIADALGPAADLPGYPLTTGAPATRAAISAWAGRTHRRPAGRGEPPTIGTKEFVAWLPTLLGLVPRTAWSSRSWPTRPTTWVPASPAPRCWSPTR